MSSRLRKIKRIVSEELEDEVASDVDMSLESEEEEEQEASEVEVDQLSPSPPRNVPSRLKIKLKLGPPSATATPASSHRTSRDDEDEDEIESEDPDSDVDESTRSASVVGNGKLTARQAVLANVVGSSHVSLIGAASSKKKKPLTEVELALKREETARKRKNLSEKKLEDEKTETINRLLKKQSKSRTKKNALSTAEDRTPMEGEVAEEIFEVPQVQTVPTMYRWISTTRTRPLIEDAMQTDEPEKTTSLSFSVPIAALSQ